MEQRQRRLYHECIIHDIDPKVMETIAVNFFINASLADWKRQEECREKYGCNIPWAILLDPTSACNLHCTGCWAAEYGNDASPELMPTPEQRVETYHRIRRYRATKPLFAMDFQNDAEYVGGCIAGGRRYLHINANGDIDPCVFIHYSDSNIREKTLLEALQSPMMMTPSC